MHTGHAFRSIGIAVAVVIALSLAGCGALGGGGGGGGCGPGETKISNLDPESAEQTTITGEVTAAGSASVNVDDGSGVAFVMIGQHDLSEGDCATAEGYANTGQTSTGADATFAASNVSQA